MCLEVCKHCDNKPMKHTDTCAICFHEMQELAREEIRDEQTEREAEAQA